MSPAASTSASGTSLATAIAADLDAPRTTTACRTIYRMIEAAWEVYRPRSAG